MDIRKIGLVISHEYSVRVRKKSFILTTILTPLLLGLLICVPTAIMLLGGNQHQVVKVIDNSSLVEPYLQQEDGAEYIFTRKGTSFEQLRDSIGRDDLYAVVVISETDGEGNVTVDAYSKEPLSAEIRTNVKRAVSKAVEDNKLIKYDLANLDEILSKVKTDIKVNSMTLTESGKAKEDTVEIYMILAYLMSFLIYIFVFMFGSMVMRSVIDEKSSRVVEVIVSSVRSTELMMGKIIGVALVALTQFLIWVGLTVAIAVGVSSVASEKIIEKAGGAEALVARLPADAIQNTGTASIDLATVIQASGEDGENDDIAGIVRQVAGLDWGYIILCFIAYFLFGYLLYAAMFAAIGAAVDNESDTSQLQLPVTIPLIIGLFIMLHTFEHPSSQLSFWASIIPWTSPMVMLARIPFGVVPAWELILSLVLLALTFLATAWLSARIYRIGILTYGKKTSFKDLFKWLKQRD
ncbi:MAG: ABC transporter permease [Bacteroidales bacterium]|nr:ABC transporter permease [Candidatus Cacconaster caballi]